MAKTKISIREKRHIVHVFTLSLTAVAFISVFFELSLLFHGGWDDVNYTIVSATPLIATAALLLSIMNVVKYRSKSRDLVASLSMVAVSSLFFCFVMVYTSTVYLANS